MCDEPNFFRGSRASSSCFSSSPPFSSAEMANERRDDDEDYGVSFLLFSFFLCVCDFR